MFLRYGNGANKPEQYQRLGFIGPETFLGAVAEAERLRGLLKRVGNYKKLALICVARENTMKLYGAMPSSLGYFGHSGQPKFVRDAVKASKQRHDEASKKRPTIKPKEMDMSTFTARGVEKPATAKKKSAIQSSSTLAKSLHTLLKMK